RHDDPSIDGDMVLLRRIPPKGDRVQWDVITGEPKPASQNFRDPENELSAFIAAETTAEKVFSGTRWVRASPILSWQSKTGPRPRNHNLSGPSRCRPRSCDNLWKITGGMSKKFREIASWVPGRWPVRL